MTKCLKHSDSLKKYRVELTPAELDLIRGACYAYACKFMARARDCAICGDDEAYERYNTGAKALFKFVDLFDFGTDE